jgi:mannitol/fructose-specific phosphotransferase system IIA component (Ntr-type)
VLLSDLLTPDRVVVPMMARDKAAAIAELTQVLVARLIVGPEASAGQHVKILSHIARLLRRDAVREGLMQCRTPDEFHHTLLTVEER